MMETAGHEAEMHKARLYELTVMDRDGVSHYIKLLRMERITSDLEALPDLREVYEMFPHVPYGSMDHPAGEVDMMLCRFGLYAIDADR